MAPWQLPPGAAGSQRLYRVHFRSEDGEGRFRLTLRLEDAQTFQLQALDPLGRSVWTLHAAAGDSLLLDHRAHTACSFGDQVDLDELTLGSFPARRLPALILGRLPAEPAAAATWVGAPGDGRRQVEILDSQGRRWSADLRSGRLESWTLEGVGSGALAQLRRDGEWLRLEDRRSGLEVRWREVAAEPLRRALTRPEVPGDYRREDCFQADPG